MRISTIVPTFNRADFLPAALDSLLAQADENHEILVVNDGSTDATDSVLARYRGRVSLLAQANAGPGAARNLGLAHASGEYITFLDSDDVWLPWTLATVRRAIAENQAPAFIAGSHVDWDGASGSLPSTPAPYHDEAFPDYLATSARGLWIGTCAAAIRVDALREAGWFAADHLNAEDSDLWLRLGVAPGFIGVKSPPVFAYRRHAASAISAHAQTARGALHLIAQENRGAYPGGPQRRRERLEILTRHTRPASFACLRAGMSTEGWRIYRETARWNLRLTRWKYLLGFPFIASRP